MRRFPFGNDGKKPHERGGILVVAIIVVLAMLILAMPFLFKLSGQWRTTEKSSKSLAAFNLAEAGVDKTMWWLNPDSDKSGSDDEAIQWDFSGVNDVGVIAGIKTGLPNASDNKVIGNVQVVLTPPVGVAPNPRRRSLDSTGMVPFIAGKIVNRTVRVTLEQYYKSIFDYGFFSNEYFYIHNGFFLDAYDSRIGDHSYGGPLPGGTNSLMPDVIFGSNSYISNSDPRDPGDATWVVKVGGEGTNEIHGTIAAGGDAAEAFNSGSSQTPPNPSILDQVIQAPVDIDTFVMKQEYDLPPVDVYSLPPKEILGTIPSVGDWFTGYNSTGPQSSTGYYADRLNRAPLATEIKSGYVSPHNGTSTFSGSGTLTPANNGVYTSFMVGGHGTGGTLNISGGDVVIYVTAYGDATKAGNFYMGKSSSINIAADSSLTLILGNASATLEQGYTINAQGSPPYSSNCVILGTNQFDVPPTTDLSKLLKNAKAPDVDELRIPGLVLIEHGQGQDNGIIYAALYAPKAHMSDLQGKNHMDFFGAAIVESMNFSVQVKFHYDKALADLTLITGGYDRWKIISWQEVIGN